MNADSYLVPAAPIRTEIIIKKSRFLTAAQQAPSVEQARGVIADLRGELPDASHHVYAFRVGHGNSVIEGMSDDGEPTGTAGPPTLAVLRGSGIGDIVLITARYFGGTKLGTGGLVRAYTLSAQEALRQLPTDLKVERVLVGLELPYSLYNQITRLIGEHKGQIEEEEFGENILIIVKFTAVALESFEPRLRDLSAGAVAPIRLA